MSEKHLTTEDFDYDLPHELIAQTPLKERDQSRLLVLDSKTGEYQDDYFYNVIDRLNPGDALVMNDSRVMPARLYGVKPETGGHVEVLLLNNTDETTGKRSSSQPSVQKSVRKFLLATAS